MDLKCLLYTIYDWSKTTRLISKLFYGGHYFTHYDDVTVTGTITSIQGGALDWDWTFNIEMDQPWHYAHNLHCEITPCYPFSQEFLNSLKVGMKVSVSGTRTFDPAHLGDPDKWEIHPVKSCVIM